MTPQFLSRLRGKGLKTRLRHPIDAYWDHRLGVTTFGYIPAVGSGDDPHWQAHYTPTPYVKIFKALRRVGLGPDDVFVDFGCGLGRAVFAASWMGARRSIGVEIDEPLTEQARAAHAKSRLADRDVQFICAPAQHSSVRDCTVVFMFHPFGPGTMQEVLQQLRNDLIARPRPLRIVYENPVCAQVLDNTGWLKRIDQWPVPKLLGGNYQMAFWQAAALPST